jgi:Ca2+-binding RTX toxin-like protein
MFAPVGSRVTEVRFVVPGSDVAATTSAFGAFFLDVDSVNATSMQFFSRSGASLGTYTVPSAPGNQGLSFLGAIFPGPDRIARVEITSGVAALAPGQKDNQADVVAMDDFVWAEPQPGNGCTINGTGGDDHLIGTGGNDVICGFDGKDSISGGGGNDTIVGGADKDSIVGGDGKDTIVGQTGNDTLKGGKGADLIESSNDAGGADTVDGGQGADRCIADQEDTVTNCP